MAIVALCVDSKKNPLNKEVRVFWGVFLGFQFQKMKSTAVIVLKILRVKYVLVPQLFKIFVFWSLD